MPAGAEDRRSHLCFVLLEEASVPVGARVVSAFSDLAPQDVAPPTAEAMDQTLQFKFSDGAVAIVALMPVPVPNGEADAAFKFSYSADVSETGALGPHSAHLVVHLRDGEGRTRYEGLVRFTYLLAAIADAADAVGLYWGAACATHERYYFVERTRLADPDYMVALWSGVEVVPAGAERMSVLSLGMRRQLGLMDLHMTSPREMEYLGTLYDFLAYVARYGENLPEGATIGRTDDEKLPVRHEASPANPQQTVWRVDLP